MNQPTQMSPSLHMYKFLVSQGAITQEDLEAISREVRDVLPNGKHDEIGAYVENYLTRNFNVSSQMIGEAIKHFYRVAYFHFQPDTLEVPVNLLSSLKRSLLDETSWLPLEDNGDSVVCVTSDPLYGTQKNPTPSVIFPGKRVLWKATTYQEYSLYKEWLYEKAGYASLSHDDGGGHIDDLISNLSVNEEEEAAQEAVSESDSEVVRLVNKIITDGHRQNASDIHIEPINRGSKGNSIVRVRFRIDGSLVPYVELPYKFRAAIAARLKVMSRLDIAERRKPQDGKIKMSEFVQNFDIELRVATLPSQGGMEDIVLRILAASEPIPMENMGFSERNMKMLLPAIEKPYGLFFVCGPTGSGKTTTLHSILKHLNQIDTKIWTAEDPIEITQEGLRQVQVNKKAGIGFPEIMRAFLRADPDVIMVGEMRDHETVKIGIEASLTGHMVLSTLHTNSAPESVIRLLDMGMDPFNFADALVGILAQRLTKRLCQDCKVRYEASDSEIEELMDEYSTELAKTDEWMKEPGWARTRELNDWRRRFAAEDGKIYLYKPCGCAKCNGGYRGRIGLHELMPVTKDVKRSIQQKQRPEEISKVAISAGMRTLKQDGIEKVLQGMTDISQVRKVCIS